MYNNQIKYKIKHSLLDNIFFLQCFTNYLIWSLVMKTAFLIELGLYFYLHPLHKHIQWLKPWSWKSYLKSHNKDFETTQNFKIVILSDSVNKHLRTILRDCWDKCTTLYYIYYTYFIQWLIAYGFNSWGFLWVLDIV